MQCRRWTATCGAVASLHPPRARRGRRHPVPAQRAGPLPALVRRDAVGDPRLRGLRALRAGVRRAAGEAADGLIWATVNGTYGDPLAAAFHPAYRREHGRPPGRSHAGIAYDSVHLLAQAWGSVANPRRFRDVAAACAAPPYRGVNGAYYLGTPGQSALAYPNVTPDPSLGQAHLTFQIQGGRHRILAAHPYADAAFRTPPWFPPEAA